MKAVERYALRLERKKYLVRAWRKARSLTSVANRTDAIRPNDVLCFCTVRNELIRLKFFLQYYREKGVSQFLFVDNGSTDGTREFLAEQPDCSVWMTESSYKQARYGMDWMNRLLRLYGDRHWCLVVDVDEFLVYPFSDTRPIPALTDWLDGSSIKTFGAMILDMYPKGPINAQPYEPGTDPFEIACWFDAGNYVMERNYDYGNLWIQGGPRARAFFADMPERAPALNKIPLVRWRKHYAFASSTHMMLPRGLNLVYDEWGGEKTSGVLLHAKFLDTFTSKVAEELERREHFAASAEYRTYYAGLRENPDFWNKWSERYINWRQLEILGLMSKGNWA